MCLIVFKENEDSSFSNRQFKSMINSNADGFGIMYRENGRVLVDKCVGSKREKFNMWQKYRHIDQYAMHARLTTHGKTDEVNCHPYEVLSIDKGDPIDLFMMHNGVLSQAPAVDKDFSDTWHFVEYIIKPIAKANLDLLWEGEEFQQWLQKTIIGSKLLFMRSDDVQFPVLILNSQAGHEQGGCWLSNTRSTVAYPKPITKVFPEGKTNGAGHTVSTTKDTAIVSPYQAQLDHEWEGWINKKEAERSRTFPILGDNSNVIHMPPHVPNISSPNDYLNEYVILLEGMSAVSVKEWVKDDPDVAADIVMALHKDNLLSYEQIIQKIKDKDSIDEIVDVVRHVVSISCAPKNVKNVS